MNRENPNPSPMRAALEALIAVSIVVLGTILAGSLLTSALRLPPLIPLPWNWLGVPVAIAGVGALLYCGVFISRRGRGTPYPRLPPASLVTTGPFAHVRNPIIESWGALLLGVAIATNWTGLLLLMVPGFVFTHLYLVYHEEPILRIRFGTAYDEYRSRVPRWIPRLRT